MRYIVRPVTMYDVIDTQAEEPRIVFNTRDGDDAHAHAADLEQYEPPAETESV